MEEKKVQPQRPTNPNFNSNARKDIPRPPVRPIPKPPQRPEVKHEISQQKFEEKGGVEKKVEAVKSQPVEPKVKKEKPVDMATAAIYESLEERMKNILGTKVSIHRRSKHKGQIEIEYYSEQELERLLDLIQTIQS